MQDAIGSPATTDMLPLLREATGPSHERLDASFGALDLSTREGLARFLLAHAAGLEPMFPIFRAFVERELHLECPDYPAMLRADLAALGVTPPAAVDAPPALFVPGAEIGVAYVVAGSRLGLVVIRQRGYWGERQGFRSAYMTDGRGHEAWKALVPLLRSRACQPEQANSIREAALAAFDTFARAFAASAPAKTFVNG